ISIWEGDKDVLGYKGFYFWYQNREEAKGFEVAFANLEKPLPFADDSVALVVGLDTFHRFDQSLLLSEMLRVTTDDAAIIFPHVHLSNNEPDPFFERGCRQLHGTDYDRFFQRMLTKTERVGMVFPEPEMFALNELSESGKAPLQSQPNSHHYNSCIAILPKYWLAEEQLQAFRFKDLGPIDNCHILINPLLDISLHQAIVRLNRGYLSDRVGYLLDRHPIYMEKLQKAADYRLSELECKLLFWAGQLFSVAEIAEKTGYSIESLSATLEELQTRDIVQVVPVSKQSIRLQAFVSTQTYIVPKNEQTISALWERAVRNYAEELFLISEMDESEFTYADSDELIRQIQARLTQAGLQKGDKLAIISSNHFEAVLTLLAATQLGLVVVPIEYDLPASSIRYIIDQVQPKLTFLSPTNAERLSTLFSSQATILFDEEEETDGVLFSDWLMDTEEVLEVPNASVEAEDLAVILYTSGSTGLPKGVQLSHGHLMRSARLISETYQWRKTDRFLALGELDSMSGLRNCCFAPLEVGAAVVIPDVRNKGNLFGICETIGNYEATLLGTTPAFLSQAVKFERRIKADLRSLRQVICTGSNLYPALRQSFLDLFNIPILNYYGLTETTGICTAETEENHQLNQHTIGKPIACVAQIIRDDGQLAKPGEKGELRIYSENIMQGYFANPKLTAQVVRDGWFYTGDYASFTEDGHIELMGRKREIIKTADGNLVFASEIEDCLQEQTTLIKEAAVTALHEDGMEKIIAFVVPQSTESDLEAIEKALKVHVVQRLGKRKAPLRFVPISALPISANGKVLKAQLVEQYLQATLISTK
nr:acyl--CoA ligase [Saprospiraceae bacterium]